MDRKILGCALVADGPPAVVSVQRNCTDCGALVWVATSGVVGITELGLEPLCLPCAIAVGIQIQPPPDPMRALQVLELIRRRRGWN